MSMSKKGGAKLSRSETVTVRLDPKLRYLADLAARHHRRTLSSFIEWAIEDVLKRTYIGSESNSKPLYESAKYLWDINEVTRLLLLADSYPELLTHEEQILWNFINEYSFFSSEFKEVFNFFIREAPPPKKLNLSLIRDCWAELKGFLNGTNSEEELRSKMKSYYHIPF